MKPSLSIVIPAFNEEDNLDVCMRNVLKSVDGLVEDFEVIVINDGSKDKTAAIAASWAKKDPRFRLVSNETNQGYGFSYRRGVQVAVKDHIGVYTSDNDMSWESFRDLVKHIGQGDILSSHMSNKKEREWPRLLLSQIFLVMMNGMFNMRLKYINGPFIARREILQAVDIHSTGLTVLAECKVKLIKQGYTCAEVPFTYVRRQGGKSSALRLKSIYATLQAVVLLLRDVYFRKEPHGKH